jgi:hypothetical protein
MVWVLYKQLFPQRFDMNFVEAEKVRKIHNLILKKKVSVKTIRKTMSMTGTELGKMLRFREYDDQKADNIIRFLEGQ